MEALDRLARAAEALCSALLDLAERPLAERVEALADALAELYAAGRALPPAAPADPPPPGPAPPADLGRFALAEDGSALAEHLGQVERWAWAGLAAWQAGEPERARALWAGGWPRWSGEALRALVALHAASETFRAAERPSARPRRAPPEIVPLAKKERGQLGIRFEPLGLGVLVREVAAGGAADGLVRAGDVLLSADGQPLDLLDAGAVAERLVGAPGEARRVEVYRDGETFEVTLVAR